MLNSWIRVPGQGPGPGIKEDRGIELPLSLFNLGGSGEAGRAINMIATSSVGGSVGPWL